MVANQPVSGNHSDLPGTNVRKTLDLSNCENIRSATVLLGSYDRNNGFIHDQFYSQMLPAFPDETELCFKELPITQHNEGSRVSTLHVAKAIDDLNEYTNGQPQLYLKPLERLDEQSECFSYDDAIKYAYSEAECFRFTQENDKQFVFGKSRALDIPQDELLYQAKTTSLKDLLADEDDDQQDFDQLSNENKKRLVDILCHIEHTFDRIFRDLPQREHNWKYCEIKDAYPNYKKTVIKSTACFLNSDRQQAAQSAYFQSLKEAEAEIFKELDADRHPVLRKTMRVLTNTLFVLGTAGLGLIGTAVANKDKNVSMADKLFPFCAHTQSSARVHTLTDKISL